MSDLAATTCGGCSNGDNGCSWIIILLLLCSCSGNGNGFGLATTDVDAVPTTDVAQSSGSYLFFAAAVAAVSKCPQHCHLLPFCSNNIS